MDIIWLIIIGILLLILGFILGYYFCKFRHRVNDMLKLADTLADLVAGNITPEKALEIIKKIEEE